jgi:hypothetical protein
MADRTFAVAITRRRENTGPESDLRDPPILGPLETLIVLGMYPGEFFGVPRVQNLMSPDHED